MELINEFRYLDISKQGYSGAKVRIDTVEKKVVKTDISGSTTLKYQHNVLQELSTKVRGKIRVPKVLAFSSQNGIDSLSIELIKGVTLYQIFKSGELMRGNILLRTLWYDWIENILNNVQLNDLPSCKDNRNLRDRIDKIKDAATRLGIENNKELLKCLNLVKNLSVSKLKYCHGDLNMENVIVSEGYLYLIDFIPSPFPSLEQDLSKLVQDGIGGWAGRFESNESINFELFLVVDRLVKDAVNCNIVNYYLLRDLSFFSMLRILPYVSGATEAVRWLRCLKRVQKYFT